MGITTVITSGKGGVGKSTVSAGLGCALAERGQSVLIMDGDAGLRSLDLITGVAGETVFDLADIFAGNCEPIRAIYSSPVYPGVSLIPAPVQLQKLCTANELRRLCKGFARYFDHVIVDCPAGVGEGFQTAVAAANRALIITTPDMVCARDGAIVGDLLRQKGVSSRLIINRLRATPILNGSTPDVDDIIDTVGVRLLGILPEDEKVAVASANGNPLPRNSTATEGFRNIAGRLLGDQLPLLPLEKLAP